jgi:hypothetical protein
VFSVLIEPKRKTNSAADAGVEKKAARPSRAVAADDILVRENILFPSSPAVSRFSSQHLSVAWGGTLTAATLTFAN